MKKILLVLLCLLFLFGCSEEGVTVIDEPLASPELKIKGFYLEQRAMYLIPHYIISRTDNGYFVKVTDTVQEDVFQYSDQLLDDEYASLVEISAEEFWELSDILLKHRILDLDGFHESKTSDVLDSGDGFRLLVRLADQKEIAASGHNVFFEGYDVFLRELTQFVDKHTDYSRYQATDLLQEDPGFLLFLFEDGNALKVYRLELEKSNRRWSIVINDGDGKFTGKSVDIADYGTATEELPFDRFIRIIDSLDKQKEEDYSNWHVTILITFENGKRYEYSANFNDENAPIVREMVLEMKEYYDELNGN